MSKTKNGGPAFPRPGFVDPTRGTLPDGDSFSDGQDGLSLRDYFAGQSLVGILSSNKFNEAIGTLTHDGKHGVAMIAGTAYGIADAMLKAREA